MINPILAVFVSLLLVFTLLALSGWWIFIVFKPRKVEKRATPQKNQEKSQIRLLSPDALKQKRRQELVVIFSISTLGFIFEFNDYLLSGNSYTTEADFLNFIFLLSLALIVVFSLRAYFRIGKESGAATQARWLRMVRAESGDPKQGEPSIQQVEYSHKELELDLTGSCISMIIGLLVTLYFGYGFLVGPYDDSHTTAFFIALLFWIPAILMAWSEELKKKEELGEIEKSIFFIVRAAVFLLKWLLVIGLIIAAISFLVSLSPFTIIIFLLILILIKLW